MVTKPAQYIEELVAALAGLDTDLLERLSRRLVETYMAGRTVFVCGNGGSASTASHLATDLTKLTAPAGAERRLRCMALTESASTITAVGNDLSYHDVFVEQLRAWMVPGDVVIGISTGGSSSNVLRAIEYANENGGFTVGITGSHGHDLRRLAHETVVIGSTSMQRVEDISMIAAHLLVLLTKDACCAALDSSAAGVVEIARGTSRSGEAA
jgi:D-sedoheptulose 7-phosphate isomerase